MGVVLGMLALAGTVLDFYVSEALQFRLFFQRRPARYYHVREFKGAEFCHLTLLSKK